MQQPRQHTIWKAPKSEWVKINWDAAVHEKQYTMGIGAVIRYDHKQIMVCLSSSQTFYSQPIVVELKALWKALHFCMDIGFECAYFEGDSQQMVNAINT